MEKKEEIIKMIQSIYGNIADKKEDINMLNEILMDKELMIEKNYGSNFEDSYKLGGFYLSKKKDADVFQIYWPEDNNYCNKDDLKLIEAIRKKKYSPDIAHRILVFIKDLEFKNQKKTLTIKSLDDYVIEENK